MDYLIGYLGFGGIEESATHTGTIDSLLEHVTFIEERGGHSLTVTDVITGSVVYEDGRLVVQEVSGEIDHN